MICGGLVPVTTRMHGLTTVLPDIDVVELAELTMYTGSDAILAGVTALSAILAVVTALLAMVADIEALAVPLNEAEPVTFPVSDIVRAVCNLVAEAALPLDARAPMSDAVGLSCDVYTLPHAVHDTPELEPVP